MEITTLIPKKHFVRKGVNSHENLMTNLILDNAKASRLCSDVKNVKINKYTQGYIGSDFIPILRKKFVDNVLYFMLVPEKTIEDGKTPYCGRGCTFIDECLKMYNNLATTKTKDKIKLTRKPLRTISLENRVVGSSETADAILEFLNKNPHIVERFKASFPEEEEKETKIGFVSYKIALANNSYKKSMKFLKFATKKLSIDGLFLQDLDITSDHGCNFDKHELIEILKNNPEFITHCRIIENDKTVGKHCLSFMYTCPQTGIKIRFKIYNKFIQCMETSSVTEQFGYSVPNWINNKEEKLRNSILNSLAYGFSRLEMTVYSTEFQGVDFYDKQMNFLKKWTLNTGKMYKTPIQDQWRAFTDELTCNMCILDHTTNELGIAMWCNTLTRKISGVFLKVPPAWINNTEKMERWILAHYSFNNGPINLIKITESDEDYFKATLTSFIKIGVNKHTYVVANSPNNGFLHSVKQAANRSGSAFRENSPNDMGLIDTPSVNLRIYEEIPKIASSGLLCEFEQIIPFVDSINCKNTRQRNIAEKNIVDMENLAEELKKIRILNDSKLEEHLQKRHVEEENKKIISDIVKSLSARNATTLRSEEYKNTEISVQAFKTVSTRFKDETYILLTDKGTFWSNSYLDVAIKNHINKVTKHSMGFYHSPSTQYIFKFFHGGIMISTSKNEMASISRIKFHKDLQLEDEITNIILDTIPEHKSTHLLKIDDFLENTTFEVQGLHKFNLRSKTRYTIKIADKLYISNTWFEDIMLDRFDKIMENNVKFTAKSLEKVTHLIAKKKELQFAF